MAVNWTKILSFLILIVCFAVAFAFGLMFASEGYFSLPVGKDCNCVICKDCPVLTATPGSDVWLKLFLLSRFKEYDVNKFESLAFGAGEGRFWWQGLDYNFYGVLCVPGVDANKGKTCCSGGQLDANRSRVVVSDWSVECYG